MIKLCFPKGQGNDKDKIESDYFAKGTQHTGGRSWIREKCISILLMILNLGLDDELIRDNYYILQLHVFSLCL